MIRLKWHRSCPWCGMQLEKEKPEDRFHCGNCGWEDTPRIWPEKMT